MTDHEIKIGLEAMASQIRLWLKWHRERRDMEGLTTDDGTHIIALPVPVWPSHGQFELWIKTMDAARAALHE